jgi:hypothetical protein
MKRTLDWDAIQTRETIRQAAYDIASSGACDGWQDVWRFLRTTFGVDQLVEIFGNPLCQMDLDQRCARAHSPGNVVAVDEKCDPTEISRKASLDSEAAKRWGNDRETLRTRRMAKQIHELLADGRECTAMQIAQALGTTRNNVLAAVRAMLDDEVLQVCRYISANSGGRRARVFVRTDVAALTKHVEIALSAPCPQPGAGLVSAIDAIARRRR